MTDEQFLNEKEVARQASIAKGVETRKRRREQRIARIAKDYLLGKFISNRHTCANCKRPLSDPTSVSRGLGTECWPSLMDHLSRMTPKVEADIAKHQQQIAELEKRDLDFFLAKNAGWHNPEAGQRYAAYECERTLQLIEQLRRSLADAEALLEAARRWSSPLLEKADAMTAEG